jgi:hypothetical protein
MSARHVRVRIDRLVVPSSLAHEGDAIRAALRSRIASSLPSTGGLTARSLDSIDAGHVAEPTAQSVGSRIGEVVARRALK